MEFTPEQLKAILKNSQIKADHEFEAPPIVLEIEGEFGKQIFATLGNFSTILARPKVGKTTFSAIVISSLLSKKQLLKFIPKSPDETKNNTLD
jgi:hypothetical protein